MVSASPAERERAYGLAVFAAAAFLLGIGLIATLERVGAPDGFVQALGPLLALLGSSVIGIVTRAPNLLDFLAARRSAPTFCGGLAFAATAVGLVMAIASAPSEAPPLPWPGVAIGLAIAALIVAPGLRGAKASALADVLATGFPARSTRVVFALALAATSLLTAIAGFDLAADTLVGAIGPSRRVANGLVMLALALSIVPGGFKGLIWSDAACGGGALLIAAIGAALAFAHGSAPFAPLAASAKAALFEPVLAGADSPVWRQIAAAVAVAGFFALTPPAIGAGAVGRARRIGLAGLLFAAVGLALAGVALPYFDALRTGPSHTATGLIGAAVWLPALALARAGVLGTTRAGGLDLATAHSRLSVLSSRRIALNRLGMLAIIALLPWAADLRWMDSGGAVFLALAIGLAFITPSVLLTLVGRPSAAAAAATLGAGLAAAAARLAFVGAPQPGPALLTGSLIVGVASFVAGTAFSLIFPGVGGGAPRSIADPFVDIPLDGID